MSVFEGQIDLSKRAKPARRIAAGAIVALAILAGAATLVALVGGALLLERAGRPVSGVGIVALGGLLVAGLSATILAVAAVTIGRQMTGLLDQIASLEQRTAVLAEQSVARSRAEAPVSPAMDVTELRGLLADIRDILLLPQEQRVRRYLALVEAEFGRRLAAVERYIESRDFHRARDELSALAERFGADDRIQEARTRLEQAADAARAHDITQAGARLHDLLGMNRWDEAEQLARELADKYPAAPETQNLPERITRERMLFEQRHRQRMHDEIQQFVYQRRWIDAAEAAHRFIANFPTGQDTDILRTQVETLDANADIQRRQQLEQQIKESVQNHRYWDALDLARRVIADFPFSPQANVLRGQVARLEELARRMEPQR
ncbi:MAG: hypothetical protein AMXMBFR13_47810 [Phycisphaerae bacterium]